MINRRKFLRSSLLWVPVAPAILKCSMFGQDVVPTRRKGFPNSVASAAGALSLPQTANLILQLESTDFDGSSNGANVTTWSDKSSGVHHFNLTGGGLLLAPSAPTVDGTNLCNGHKTVRFAGANMIGAAAFDFAASPGVEFMAVFQADSQSGGSGDYFFELMRPNNGTQAIEPFSGGTFFECFGRTDRPAIGAPVTSITSFCAYDVTSKSDGTLYAAWVNKEVLINVGSGYTFAHGQGATQTTIGGAYTGVSNIFGTGNIAAVYAWNVSLSTAERTQARTYITNLWNVSFA